MFYFDICNVKPGSKMTYCISLCYAEDTLRNKHTKLPENVV